MTNNLTRRRFLKLTAGVLAGSALAACGATPTATPVPPTATLVPPTKAPAAPTMAPAAPTAVPAAPTATKPPAAPTATAAPVAATPAAGSTVKGEIVTVFHYGQWDDTQFGPIAQRFNKLYPNITLTGINTNGDAPFVQKVTTMAAGGTPPDLMSQTIGRMVALAPTGVYEDLGPRVDASALMQRIKPMLPDKGTTAMFLGKLYGVPYNQNMNMWFYNKDLFDKAGVAIPPANWTWNDVITLGQKLTDQKNNIYFVDPGTTSFNNLADRIRGNGSTIFSADFKHLNFDQQANIDAVAFWVELYTKYKVCPSPELKLGDIGFTFDTGKLAMSRNTTGDTLPVQLGAKPTWAFKWGVTLPPAGPKKQFVYNSLNIWSNGKGAKNANLAWQLLSWDLDDDEQTAEAKAGSTVARNDIVRAVTIPTLRADLQAPMTAALDMLGAMELCPGHSACQTIYNNEMAPAYLGRITPQEGCANTQAKGQPALEDVMKQLGLW